MRSLTTKSLLFVLLQGTTGALSADPVVIVHPACKTTGGLELVQRVFLGKERSLCSSKPVQLVDVDEKNPIRDVYLRRIAEKTDKELHQYWSRLVFTGQGTPPAIIGDDAAVKKWVAQNEDAIGVIDSKSVDDTVKVLLKITEPAP